MGLEFEEFKSYEMKTNCDLRMLLRNLTHWFDVSHTPGNLQMDLKEI
jgi:hypothetical protein